LFPDMAWYAGHTQAVTALSYVFKVADRFQHCGVV